MLRTALVTVGILALLTGPGCFKSSTLQASSESSSASSYSSSGSSSRSSSPGYGYQVELRNATKEWILSGGDVESFKLEVARLAGEHGVTDWQAYEGTWDAIGRGLKRSGVRGERLEQVKQALAGSDEQAAEWIQKGYDAE